MLTKTKMSVEVGLSLLLPSRHSHVSYAHNIALPLVWLTSNHRQKRLALDHAGESEGGRRIRNLKSYFMEIVRQDFDLYRWGGSIILMQNKKYRSRTEIICDILQTASGDGNGVVQTKIMYNAFLSYHQVKDYLSILIDNDLLQHDLGNQKFRITEKGLRFLQLCDQIGDLVEKEEEDKFDGTG